MEYLAHICCFLIHHAQISRDVLNPGGIIRQYTDMIDYCQFQLSAVLKIVTFEQDQAWVYMYSGLFGLFNITITTVP